MTGISCTKQLDDAGNVLVCTSSLSDTERNVCMDLLNVADPSDLNALFVSFSESYEEVINQLHDRVGELPTQLGIITMDDFIRSASSDDGFFPLDHTGTSLAAAADPSDAIEVGIQISEYFESCGVSFGCPPDERIVVCFDSLTGLLQYEDIPQVYRFLHVLTGLLRSLDAVAHFHIDPEAHGNEHIPTLRGLFDVVIETDKDGEVTVTKR